MIVASRRRKEAQSVDAADKAAEAAVDKSVDYSDEVTTEQMLRIERAYAHLRMHNWKVKAGPAW